VRKGDLKKRGGLGLELERFMYFVKEKAWRRQQKR
jgi:hypothetical protein